MEEPKTILYDLKLPKSHDYHFLRKEGIKYAQQLSGKIWTDYNEHDPGVTILEQFCYALADVAYRTNIDIQKLLFAGEDYKSIADANVLYAPNEIVPCAATTILDFRIAIIDTITEVNNAWVTPVDPAGTKQDINGLIDVVLQLSSDTPEDDYHTIKEQVRDKYIKDYRNLGEDINEIKVLRPLPVEVTMKLDIASEAVGEEIVAEIYYLINSYFNPQVQFYSFEELNNEETDLFDTFQTSSFEHGFIKANELSSHRGSAQVSGILELISKVAGVRYVSNLQVKKKGVRVFGDTLIIGDNYFVSLKNITSEDISKNDITITKGGVFYDHDPGLILHLYEMKAAKNKPGYKLKSKLSFDKGVGKINTSGLANFSSIQNTLPGVYGVGKYDLPPYVGKKRMAEAKQLKGYLYFFDQILANHLAQLQKVKEIFSIQDDGNASYFTKAPTNFSGLIDLFGEPDDQQVRDIMAKERIGETEARQLAAEHNVGELVNEITAEFDGFADRKNKILDHLLARFGENFSAHVQGNTKSLFGNMDSETIKMKLIALKKELLKNYVEISRYRFKAFEYNEPSWDKKNISTFQKRLYLFLNIKQETNKNKENEKKWHSSLVAHFKKTDYNIHNPGDTPISTNDAGNSDKGSVPYKEAPESAGKFTFLIKDKSAIQFLFKFGSTRENYRLIEAEEGRFIVLFNAKRSEAPVKVCEVDSIQEGKDAISKLVKHFSQFNQASEGFHLVEHILLRSLALTDHRFHILDDNDNVLFDSLKSADLSTQKALAQEALFLGCQAKNYKIVQTGEGETNLYITNKSGEEVAKLAQPLEAQEPIGDKIKALVKYFKVIDLEGAAVDTKLTFGLGEEQAKQPLKTQDTFFKSRVSMVMPNWVPRFQSTEFTTLLKNTIAQCAPAHLGINLIWLSMSEMKSFEKVYRQWLEAKADKQKDRKELDELSQKLIQKLTSKQDG